MIPEPIDGRLLLQPDGKVISLSGYNVIRTTAPALAVASSTIVTTGTRKKIKATGVTVTFNTPVIPALLTDPRFYQVRATKGKRIVELKKKGGIAYDAPTQTLTLRFARKTAVGAGFRLVVSSGGIVAMDGQVLSTTPITIEPTTMRGRRGLPVADGQKTTLSR